MAGILHDIDSVPALQMVKKNYANAGRAERAKKRYEPARGRTRARTIAAENVETFWKAVFLLLRSTSVSRLLR